MPQTACVYGVFLFSILLVSTSSYSQLSQNSGINGSDTWIVMDLAIANNTTANLPQAIFNQATQTTSSVLPVAPATQTFHVEAGYDSSGGLVMNLWPTGTPSDSINSFGNPLGFIRFSGGQMTLFDQTGAPMPALSFQGIPMNWPLNLLGSNPGPSVISNLIVPNVSNYSSGIHAQLAYASPSTTAYVTSTTSQGSTATWTYAQSGATWMARQVAISPAISNGASTRTIQFTNMSWHDNTSADSARAARGIQLSIHKRLQAACRSWIRPARFRLRLVFA